MTQENSPIKVIHCLRAPVGGLFRHVCDLVQGQYSQGLSVGVIYDSSTEDDHAKLVFDELSPLCSLGIMHVPMSRTLKYSDLTTLKQITEFCKKVQPQIIHGHGAKGGAYARLVASLANRDVKTVYTPHGGSLHYAANSPIGMVYLGLERLLKKKTHGLIFESQYSADTYQQKLGQFPCDHKVIHNGLKEAEFDRWSVDNAEYDFVFVGELRMLKGIDVLLQAIAKVEETHPVKVLIVGTGPDKAYFRKQIENLGLNTSIVISPPIFPATDAFNLGRCVVMPSLAESFPYVVLEALAAGCPLITTNVGGIPEIFGPYKNDLIAAGDVSALADAMLFAMENPDQLAIRLTQIQAFIKSQFGIQQMLDEVKLYYDEILGKGIRQERTNNRTL